MRISKSPMRMRRCRDEERLDFASLDTDGSSRLTDRHRLDRKAWLTTATQLNVRDSGRKLPAGLHKSQGFLRKEFEKAELAQYGSKQPQPNFG